MDDYLIFDRSSRTCDAQGFDHDHACWSLIGTGINVTLGETIFLRKPPLSSHPLFYAVTPDVFIAAPNWIQLLTLLKQYSLSPAVNVRYIFDYLQFQCPFTRETLCAEIFTLRNGETVTIQADGSQTSSLTPFAPADDCAPPDIENALHDQLTLLQCESTYFHISAGLDSSILAILSSEIHQDKPIHVATCETRGAGSRDEVGVVKQLAEQFRFDLHVFDFSDIDLLATGRELIHALGYPIAHPSHLVRYLLDQQIADRADTVVTGRGPDECLGGYIWHTKEFADRARYWNRLHVTSGEWLQRLFLREPKGRNKQAPFRISDEPLSLRRRLQHDLWTIFESWNIIDHALGRALGLAVCNPFLDEQLMGELLALPDSFRLREGTQKWLLRETFASRYPDYLLNQPKRGLRIDVRPYLVDYSFQELFDTLYTHSPFAEAFLNRRGCEKLIQEILTGEQNLGWQFWSLYVCSQAYELITDQA